MSGRSLPCSTSAARNAGWVPGLRVFGDVLCPAEGTIGTVGVLVSKRAAMRYAEQLRLFVVPKLAGVVVAEHSCQRVVDVPRVLFGTIGGAV